MIELTERQRVAVDAPSGPLAIIAGAGTGKTTTAVARIAELVRRRDVAPEEVLAVTHSRKAAGELRDRLLVLGADVPGLDRVTARTFHSAAFQLLRECWERTGRSGDGPQLIGSKYAALRATMRAAGLRPSSEEVRDVTAEISWAQVSLVDPAGYAPAALAANRRSSSDPAAVADLYSRYTSAKAAAGRCDFEDLLAILAQLICSDAQTAAVLHRRYRHFVVDEFQDTDPLQDRLLGALLGGRDQLTVVGDPRQCIYSFKGANPDLLAGFARRFEAAVVVNLVENFRSEPRIITWANNLDAAMRTAAPTETLVATLPDDVGPCVSVLTDEADETTHVARRITGLLADGVPASQIAVLYRFNSQSVRFEEVLAAAGIPVHLPESEAFFSRPEVLAVLRPFGAAARAEPYRPGLDLLLEHARATGWDPDDPPGAAGAVRERWEVLAALVGIVEAMAGPPDADTVLTELLTRAREAHVPTPAGVTLATLHRAKGLEWDVVFIPACVEGSIPSVYARGAEQLAEERRLLYVGVTRARKRLELSWACTRRSGSNSYPNKPSRFLVELEASRRARPTTHTRSPKGPEAPLAAPGRCAGCGESLRGPHQRRMRRCPACLEGPDAALKRRLEEFRTAIADERGCDAGAVMSGPAVFACVATRPGSPAGLEPIAGLELDAVEQAALIELIAARGS